MPVLGKEDAKEKGSPVFDLKEISKPTTVHTSISTSFNTLKNQVTHYRKELSWETVSCTRKHH